MDEFLNPVGPRQQHVMDPNKIGVPIDPREGFEEGSQEITLPSKGVFYMPPYNNVDEITVRNLDWRDEDILTTKKYIEDGTVYDKLVSSVIQNKGMDAYSLVPIDRDTILLWLRANSLGPDFSLNYKCPKCGHTHEAHWDLSKLEIPKYSEAIYNELKQNAEVRIVTPLKNIPVFIKIPLIRESRDTEKRLNNIKEKNNSDMDLLGTGIIDLIVSGVEEENGTIIRNKESIKRFFDKIKLPLIDLRYIKKKVEDLNLRYDTAQDLKCKNCGHVMEGVELPIVHPNFLWPDLGDEL